MSAHVKLVLTLTVVLGLHSSTCTTTGTPGSISIETSMESTSISSTPTTVAPESTSGIFSINSDDSSNMISSTWNSSSEDTTAYSSSASSEWISPTSSSTISESTSSINSDSESVTVTEISGTNDLSSSTWSLSDTMQTTVLDPSASTQVSPTFDSSSTSYPMEDSETTATYSTEYSPTIGGSSSMVSSDNSGSGDSSSMLSSDDSGSSSTMSTLASTSVISSMPSMTDGVSTTDLGLISTTPVLATSSINNTVEENNTMSMDMTSSVETSSINSTINFTASVMVPSTTVMTSTQASDEVTMSSTVPTSSAPTTTQTTTTTTTTAPPTTTVKYPTVPGNIDNAIFEVSFDLTFLCKNFNETEIKKDFEKHAEFQSVTLKPEVAGCTSNGNRRKKRDTHSEPKEFTVEARVRAILSDSIKNATREVLEALNTDGRINMSNGEIDNIISSVENQTSNVCESTYYCPSGYKCSWKLSSNSTCYFMCDPTAFDIDCGPHGECNVEVEIKNSELKRKCSCVTDTFYQYGGERCETKEMTWQMILAIAGGCAGAIIVILVFVIIITCVRKKRTSGYNKYSSHGSELNYADLIEPQQRTSARHYQGLRPSEDRSFSGNTQGYENKAYDYSGYIEGDNDLHYRTSAHATNDSRATNGSRAINGSREREWNPDESADVYAKLSTQFDDVNYQYNIKRAQLKRSDDNNDAKTGF